MTCARCQGSLVITEGAAFEHPCPDCTCSTVGCVREAHKGTSHQDVGGVWFGGDEWETPPMLFERLRRVSLDLTGEPFRTDVCASVTNRKVITSYWTKTHDALAETPDAWSAAGPCWMNPPYSGIGPWVERCAEAQAIGGIIFALVPASPETAWWRNHIWGVADMVLPLSRRIRFVGAKDSAKGANVVVVYRPHLGDTRWVPFEITTTEAGNKRKENTT